MRAEEEKKEERRKGEELELEKSDIRNKAKLIFCLARYRVGSRWNPVYFKRINFPFDQHTGLLVCGIGLTARGETRRGLKGLSIGVGDRGWI